MSVSFILCETCVFTFGHSAINIISSLLSISMSSPLMRSSSVVIFFPVTVPVRTDQKKLLLNKARSEGNFQMSSDFIDMSEFGS